MLDQSKPCGRRVNCGLMILEYSAVSGWCLKAAPVEGAGPNNLHHLGTGQFLIDLRGLEDMLMFLPKFTVL